MFNRKRQVRECTNQLLEFDTYDKRMNVLKTTGFSAGARKHHVATVYKKSMIVYGGQSESGVPYNEMIVLQLEYLEWMKIQLKQGMAPFIQGACCSVQAVNRRESSSENGMVEPVRKVSETLKLQTSVFINFLCYLFLRAMQLLRESITSVEGTPREKFRTS